MLVILVGQLAADLHLQDFTCILFFDLNLIVEFLLLELDVSFLPFNALI